MIETSHYEDRILEMIFLIFPSLYFILGRGDDKCGYLYTA